MRKKGLDRRFFIELSFKGTNYHGWQIQPNALTIQQLLEESLQLLLNEKIRLTGSGRTDTGVHAGYFVAHFNSASPELEAPREIVRKLNHILPEDIAIFSIFPVRDKDHSRFSALSRTYKYYISRQKNPFRQDTSFFIGTELDVNAMNSAAGELFKNSDFTSFCRSNTNVRTHICKIRHASWEEREGMLVFTVQADRFLRNMVRAVVGTILEVGYGKLSVEDFIRIIEAKDRRRAGTTAPAKGLILTGIEYPPEIFLQKPDNGYRGSRHKNYPY